MERAERVLVRYVEDVLFAVQEVPREVLQIGRQRGWIGREDLELHMGLIDETVDHGLVDETAHEERAAHRTLAGALQDRETRQQHRSVLGQENARDLLVDRMHEQRIVSGNGGGEGADIELRAAV